MLSKLPNELPRFAYECAHFSEAASIYIERVDVLLSDMAEVYGYDDFGLYTQAIPSLHYASTVIYLYARLEQQFNEACMIVKTVKALDLKPEVFAGQGVSRARLYLEDYARLDIKLSAADCMHIAEIGKIRNCLVHGALTAKNETLLKLQSYCEQTNAFGISSTTLLVSRKTVDHVLVQISLVLAKLGSAVYSLGSDPKYQVRL